MAQRHKTSHSYKIQVTNGKPCQEEQEKDPNIEKFSPVPQLKIAADDL